METAHKTATVVFDKTGTITHGRPTVSYLGLIGNNERSDSASDSASAFSRLLSILGAAESGSEHPLAKAIVGFVKEALHLEEITGRVAQFNTVPGCGLSVVISHIEEMEAKGQPHLEAFIQQAKHNQ